MTRAAAFLTALALVTAGHCSPPSVSDAAGDATHSDPVCGLWQAGGAGGALFEVRSTETEGLYDLFIVDSPDFTVAPGSFFGSMAATGKDRCYDAALLKHPRADRQAAGDSRAHNYVFELSADGNSLDMRHYRKGFSVNFFRLFPYLFRVSVDRRSNRPSGVDGARRVGPDVLPSFINL